MQQPSPGYRTVFRACVVNAVREGEALMQKLVNIARESLARQESETRNLSQRDLANEALRLLNQHEAALLKGYPMALLEIFADGPENPVTSKAQSTGLDFGELSLVDDAQVQAQVELSRAQQLAMHTTEAVLGELNGLVSAAQGLRRVHPERNPLRPENYIRALQQVMADTGVASPIREAWMQPMRTQLGGLLVDVYKQAAQNLREQGVQPVSFASAQTPVRQGPAGPGHYGGPANAYGGAYAPGAGHPSQWSGMEPPPGYGYGAPGAGYGPPPGYGTHWGGADPGMGPDAEEALLTVGILRQMLAGGGDPYQAMVPVVSASVPLATPSQRAPVYGAPVGSRYGAAHVSAHEAMDDIAELERLVGRLAGSTQPGYVPSGHSAPRSLYGVTYGSADETSPAMAAEVVARMVANIAQDSRLLPPVQRAVQGMEPAIRKLVRHDPRFFSDAQHPARRLLDELTQRSLAYTDEKALGFRNFMRLVDQAVDHLAQKEDITSPAPFEAVLTALGNAWEKHEQKLQARRDVEKQALLKAEQRELLAERIGANVRKLPGVEDVPPDLLEFAAGPWAQVAAHAQTQQPEGSEGGDPGGYLALVPELFWSVQPALVGGDKDRLVQRIPGLLAKLREGLKSIKHPPAETSAMIERLVLLHQRVLDAVESSQQAALEEAAQAAKPKAAEQASEAPASASGVDVDLSAPTPEAAEAAPEQAATQEDPFYIGAWVDLVSNGKVVRTQLTWISPHNTLFLFTGADGSSQSMTRRMRDKLAAEGLLRILPRQHVVDSAIDAMASSGRRRRSSQRKS